MRVPLNSELKAYLPPIAKFEKNPHQDRKEQLLKNKLPDAFPFNHNIAIYRRDIPNDLLNVMNKNYDPTFCTVRDRYTRSFEHCKNDEANAKTRYNSKINRIRHSINEMKVKELDKIKVEDKKELNRLNKLRSKENKNTSSMPYNIIDKRWNNLNEYNKYLNKYRLEEYKFKLKLYVNNTRLHSTDYNILTGESKNIPIKPKLQNLN